MKQRINGRDRVLGKNHQRINILFYPSPDHAEMSIMYVN